METKDTGVFFYVNNMDENAANGAAVQPNGKEQQHARQCKGDNRIAEIVQPPPTEPPDPPSINIVHEHRVEEPQQPLPSPAEKFYWGEANGTDITNVINECYEKIVFWRKNLFMLPNGTVGKN